MAVLPGRNRSRALAVLITLLSLRGGSNTEVMLHLRNWSFGRSESIVSPHVGTRHQYFAKRTMSRAGPVEIVQMDRIQFGPVGTNELKRVDVLYHRVGTTVICKVQAIEPEHRFPDGTVQLGVLVKGIQVGSRAWLPQSKITDVTMARPFE